MITSAHEMLGAFAQGLRSIGYDGERLRDNYAYSDLPVVAADMPSEVRYVELAAFAQTPPSLRNACFGVTTTEDDSPRHAAQLRVLGAPAVFTLRPDAGYALMWRIPASGEPTRLHKINAADIAETFRENAADWNPQTVLRAKRITFLSGAPQLDFCDAGLLPALEGQLRDKLETRLNNIASQCINRYTDFHTDAEADEYLPPLFRLLFRLLAAKLLADRGERPHWRDLSAQDVIHEVEAFYHSDATAEPAMDFAPVQNVAWTALRDGLNLQNLSVETLAHLYENLFVTREVRQAFSVHATPPEIAEYLIRQLPLDKLDEDGRTVFEPFAGAAPFLIAALGSLRALLPDSMTPQERHNYFVRSLSGIEQDALAVEIARFALILADYPNPDGWRILTGDAYNSSAFTKRLREANVVICNPPFGKFDALVRRALGSDTALTKEGEALRRILLDPPAMIGVVLPRAILDRDDFAPLRKALVNRYKRLFVTVFPDVMFNEASQEVVAIAAHNVETEGPPYVSARLYPADRAKFRETGEVSWSKGWVSLSEGDDGPNLWPTDLQPVWDLLANYGTFGDIAEIHTGIRYKTGLLSQCVSDEPRPDSAAGVQTVENYAETYLIVGRQYFSMETEMMENMSYKLAWDEPKVILGRARRSRGRWHISGAMDREGLWASQQFYGVWPAGNTSVEVLSALVNNPVANAYLYSIRTGRDNQRRQIKRVPVPMFTEEQAELVTSLVQEYVLQRGGWLAEPERREYFAERCLELMFQIDAAVLEAYALPPELERQLLDAFAGQRRPGLPFDFPGYGAEYEDAKRKLQTEKAYRGILKRYHTLVDKKFLDGLTDNEAQEKERLRQRIDAHNAPFYERIFTEMDAERQ